MTTAHTKLLGVVGHPVDHSLSPAIQTAALKHDKRDAVYLAFDVEPDRLGAFIKGMAAAKVRGLNVTVPHKRAVCELCDELDEAARSAQAVNTIVFTDGRAIGYNTDIVGAKRALAELGDTRPTDKALVIGTGGAGRAAAWALHDSVEEVWLSNRTGARADKLRAALGRTAQVVPWKAMATAAASADIIVHATSVGLDGEGSVLSPYDLQRAKNCRALLDVVYGRSETPLVREARRMGMTASDGLMMLVYQAAASYEIFWEAEAPIDVMKRAAARTS